MKKIDLTGRKFTKLLVLHECVRYKKGDVIWDCLCDCGNKRIVSSESLTSGNTKSCGCIKRKNISGLKFNRLTAISINKLKEIGKHGSVQWDCICECGKFSTVSEGALCTGQIKSCGCLQHERTVEHCKKMAREYRISKGKDPDVSMVPEYERLRVPFNDLSKKIRMRDNFTCQLCFKAGGDLHAHHIYIWSKYIERRFDPKNLITLCNNCHLVKVHKWKRRTQPSKRITNKLLKLAASRPTIEFNNANSN